MVRLSLILVARAGEAKQITAELRTMMAQTRRERTCIWCEVSIDAADPNVLHYVEVWPTEDELHEQIGSRRFQHLIALMEAAAEPPQFEVQLVSRAGGLEYIEAVRRGDAS